MDKIKEIIISFWNKNKEKFFESFKASLRYLVFAIASTLITSLLKEPNLNPVLFVALTAVDKWLYENWKENDKSGVRGLFPL